MTNEIKTNFDNYLKSGEEEQDKVLKIVQLYDFGAYQEEGNFPDYDIKMPMKDITIEVKRDFRSEETQNLAFEVKFGKKPSGLAHTKADLWVTADVHYFYWFYVNELKEWITENKDLCKVVKGGDDNMSEMIIVKRNKVTNNHFCAVVCKNGSNLNILENFLKKHLNNI